MTQTFRLAPMSPLIRWLTWLLSALPMGFAVAPVANRGSAGLLWTSNGWVECYVPTLDRYVLIRRRRGIPLLLSTAQPEQMAAAVRQQIPTLNHTSSE